MSDLMLDVDQAGELKAAFRRGNWTNAEIKKACEGEFLATVRKLLHGELTIKLPELLRPVADIIVSAYTKFTASKAFIVDITPTAKVKVAYLGENFKTHFLGKVEKNIKSAALVAYQLVKDSLDQPILDQLGNKAETTLAHFYELLCRQPSGEAGPLLTNGRANIFYIKDKNGKTWAVRTLWFAGYGGWGVYADPVDGASRWDAGYQVFARK